MKTYDEYKADLNKSYKPYLTMTIIGGVIFIISFILMLFTCIYFPIMMSGATDPEQYVGAFFALLAVSIFLMVGSFGLLGPGIPLMVVTIVKQKKAKKYLSNNPKK